MPAKTEAERIEQTLCDLIRSQYQLSSALRRAGRLAGIDCKLLDKSRNEARQLVDELRLGEIKVTRWQPPSDDDDLSDIT